MKFIERFEKFEVFGEEERRKGVKRVVGPVGGYVISKWITY